MRDLAAGAYISFFVTRRLGHSNLHIVGHKAHFNNCFISTAGNLFPGTVRYFFSPRKPLTNLTLTGNFILKKALTIHVFFPMSLLALLVFRFRQAWLVFIVPTLSFLIELARIHDIVGIDDA